MSLEEFKKLLEEHDWFYMMSDDNRVYRAGNTNEWKLKEFARANGDDFKRAYNEAYAKRFHTPPFTVPHVWPFKEVAP
jgi:hypothetical protein